MANTVLITANWRTGALSQQTISMQYDNNCYVVQFVGYPEASEGNELDYYLLVWMSSAPGEKPDEIAPIQLASDQWYISNVFTQQTQQIKFQMCALNTEGTFEAHSPIFTGFVRNSLEHDGATQDIDVSTLFDAYREYLNELIIRAGAVVIDPTLTQSGQAADAKEAGDRISGIKSDLSTITGCEPIQFSDPNEHYYIKTAEVGTVLNNLTPTTQSRLSKYAIVECTPGDVFMLSGAGGGSENNLYVFVDENNTVLKRSGNFAEYTDLTKVVAPESASKIIINTRSPMENAVSYKGMLVENSISEIRGVVEETELMVSEVSEMEYFGNLYHGDGTITFVAKKTYYFDEPLPAGTYTVSALVTTTDTDADVNRALFSPGNKIATLERNTRSSGQVTLTQPATQIDFMAATNTAASTGDTATWADIMIEEGEGSGVYKHPTKTAIDYKARGSIGQEIAYVYVSADGSDETGSGTSTSPFATINHALEIGASTVLVKGGTYKQTINLALAKSNDIVICKESLNEIVTIVAPNAVIAETETLVDGYTKVYKASFAGNFNTNNIWLFQDKVPDESTLIFDDERHPLQRGYIYRCHDTKIQITQATDLSAALTEIESAIEYMWFYDSQNNMLYFSRPEPVSESNPICGSFGGTLFSNGYRKRVNLIGLNVKYMAVNFNGFASGCAKNCKVSNVFGAGCYTYNFCEDAVFNCCEAERAFTGTNGDGFNGHGVNSGNVWAKITHGTLISCWAHDNRDDGFSDHERCESLIIGGLYEYNRFGGGVTPSTGSHTECHNVYARKNGEAGFVYMNNTAAEEGGVGGQLICYGCIAENNTIWEGHTQAGFKITSTGNTGIFINCKSIGQDNAYYINETTSKVILIDCGSKDCQTLKGGAGTYIIKNTSLVV